MVYRRLLNILCFFFLMSTNLFGRYVIPGDVEDEGQTFSIPMHARVSDSDGGWYVGAREKGAKGFSIAHLATHGLYFTGVAHEKVTINDVEEQDNPLFDEPVEHLGMAGHNLVVVPKDRPQDMYMVSGNLWSLLYLPNIKDSCGVDTTAGIINLVASEDHIFAAVKNHKGDQFGSVGSGIALVEIRKVQEKKDSESQENAKKEEQKKIRSVLEQINWYLIGEAEIGKKIGAIPLDVTSDFVKINHDCTSFGDHVAFLWDPAMQRLFVGLQVETGGQEDAGACALLVGKLENGIFVFNPIAPPSFFDGEQDKIVGVVGSHAHVSIHKITTMVTTTKVRYTIVVGGNGKPEETGNMVFALPIVSDKNSEKLGLLSSSEGQLQYHFHDLNKTSLFHYRGFKDALKDDDTSVSAYDPAARVGGGPLQAGVIADITISGDSVFVSVVDTCNGDQPGIFYSQALLNVHGKVKGWTPWKRIVTSKNVFGFTVNSFIGNFTLLTGDDNDEIKTVAQTNWGLGRKDSLLPLNVILEKEFPAEEKGIHGLFDFSYNRIPGADSVSLLVATGIKKVTLIESGAVQQNGFVITDYSKVNEQRTFNGVLPVINQHDLPTIVSITGGALDSIKVVQSAAIAHVDNNSWLFVGGTGGLAVLADARGNGWSNLSSGLSELSEISFVKIGNYSHVRSLIHDGPFLYVLTNKRLDRIDLRTSHFVEGDLAVVTLASIDGTALNGSRRFNDCLVSEKCALLATNVGLFRIGNDCDVRYAQKSDDMQWKQIAIPEAHGPVVQLFAVSTTGRPQDCARGIGGHLYVMSGNLSKDTAQVNRFTINGIEGLAINDETIQPIPDFFVKNILSYYSHFGSYRDWFVTDGSLFLHCRNRNLEQEPVLRGNNAQVVPLFLNGTENNINAIARDSSSGSWLVAGDFGLRVNE